MYNKKEWQSNELITKEALNNIENGIAEVYKHVVDTVEDLKNADVKVGDIVYTLGYYQKGDGGGYVYEIVNDSSLDTEVVNIALNNGLKAKYGLNLNLYDINVLTVGIKKNDSNAEEQNSFIMEKILVKYNRKCKLYFPGGEYFISNINFIREPISNDSLEMHLYGEFAVANESSNGGNRAKINTSNKDFICDRRGLLETPIVTGLSIFMNDLYIISTNILMSALGGIPPRGVCFGQAVGTPLAQQEVNFYFNNVGITGFDYGIYSPHWACGGSGGYNISFGMCHCGIYVGQAIHCFDADKISFNDCVLGMDTGWGGVNARIKNVHVSTGYLGCDKADYDEYIGILSRGNFTIDAVYYEPYNDNGYMDRCVLIKHEGYAYGIGPLYIKNTSIGYPGSGNRGVFLKSDCYLGFGPSRGVENATTITPWDEGHYPYGAVILENCNFPQYIETLKEIVKISEAHYNATYDYKYSNVWWGYDFDGIEIQTPDLLIGLRPSLRGRGYLTKQPLESLNAFKEIHSALLSEVETLYNSNELNDTFRKNVLCGTFTGLHPTNRFVNVYDISMTIDGTISENVDVTIGIFARTDWDNSTLRLVKKIKTIKGNETYNDFEKHICFEVNPYFDLLPTENKVYFACVSNTKLADNALTFADRELIEFDYTVKRKMILGNLK